VAFRFTDLDGKRAQMEFAKIGDRDSAAADVLTLSSARHKAREYRVGLKRDGLDPRVKKRATASCLSASASERTNGTGADATKVSKPIEGARPNAAKCASPALFFSLVVMRFCGVQRLPLRVEGHEALFTPSPAPGFIPKRRDLPERHMIP
jgi:hypothetical protein